MRVPDSALRYFQKKFMLLAISEPDEIIGHNARSRKRDGHPFVVDRPFLLRWFIRPKNDRHNIYFHCFCRDDEDRALRDHPWWNVSLLLHGQYIEVTGVFDKNDKITGFKRTLYRAGDLKIRRATDAHRVELQKDKRGNPIPCYSLFMTGRVSRKWGFLCPTGWRSSTEFHDKKGCIND